MAELHNKDILLQQVVSMEDSLAISDPSSEEIQGLLDLVVRVQKQILKGNKLILLCFFEVEQEWNRFPNS